MKIFEVGQIWKGNKNGREIEILKIEHDMIQYRDLKYDTVFCFGAKTMEKCDLLLIKDVK